MNNLLRFIGLCLVSGSVLAQYQVQHLEPAFWWAGMQHPHLQLMVHGPNISQLQPALDHPGVVLAGVQRTDNPNYLFVDLTLAPDVRPGQFDIRFMQGDKVQLSYPYELRARLPGSASRAGFDQSDVIYLITPDRFANGDPANDEVDGMVEGGNRNLAGGRHGGDIQGIIQHLDYLQDLGITQLWLNPVLENAMDSYSYHGYSTTDYYQVDPRYGSNHLYRELAQQAGEREMGLIKDIILNHIGSGHWWMQDMPASDWINFDGQFVETTHRREALHDPHGTQWDRRHFTDGWFVRSMPDLNQRNPFLANYLIQNSIWWVEYAGLSGLRLDTYSYPDKDFLSQYTQRLMQEYPNLGMVGEEWSLNPAIVAYWQRDTKRHDDYQSALPSLFDFPLQAAVVNGLNNAETWGTGLREIYQALANDFLYGHPYELVVMPDNHDMSRIYTQLGHDPALFRMAMVLFATTRGIPQFFYGFEVLMANPGSEDHGVIRSDFPGGWPGDPLNAFSGENLSDEQAEAQAFVRRLLNWRKGAEVVHKGKLTHYAPIDGTYVYFRHDVKRVVMVVLNKNDQSITLPTERFKDVTATLSQAVDVLTGERQRLAELTVPARSARIYALH
ncbi:glycoside hydrolase family 13 protein [Bowmanella dokdonensis]|nr:glycoside hydrolase family 13 protein [Bowmanella dokdonensis]